MSSVTAPAVCRLCKEAEVPIPGLCPECLKIHIDDLSHHCGCGASVLRTIASILGWGRTAPGDPICKECRDEAEYLEGVRLENIGEDV